MIYLTRLKCIIRNTGLMFWVFVFPLCLGTFFYLGFGKLSQDDFINTIDVYLAQDSYDPMLLDQMKQVKISDNQFLFNINHDYSLHELENLMANNEISHMIYQTDETINFRINDNTISHTIIKSFIDQYSQVKALAIDVSQTDPTKVPNIINDFLSLKTYQTEMMTGTNPKANKMIIYFYSLIAMACLFGSMLGIDFITNLQADTSEIAARVNITPVHKFKLIINYFLACLTLHFLGNLGLIIYLKYVLQIEFSHNLGLIVLTSFIGCVGGISFGALIASLIRTSQNTKEGIMTSVSMLFSFLAGLMMVDIKFLVNKYLPLLGYINPANLISEAFYSLYYYNDLGRYSQNIAILAILASVMLVLTYFKLRGNKYDSI